MADGIYAITFRGATDWGMGMLLLRKGVVTGVDSGGVLYDGIFKMSGDHLTFDLKLTVPPGATLVQGTLPQTSAYTVPFQASVPIRAIQQNVPVLVQLPPGPVNVIVKFLRSIEG